MRWCESCGSQSGPLKQDDAAICRLIANQCWLFTSGSSCPRPCVLVLVWVRSPKRMKNKYQRALNIERRSFIDGCSSEGDSLRFIVSIIRGIIICAEALRFRAVTSLHDAISSDLAPPCSQFICALRGSDVFIVVAAVAAVDAAVAAVDAVVVVVAVAVSSATWSVNITKQWCVTRHHRRHHHRRQQIDSENGKENEIAFLFGARCIIHEARPHPPDWFLQLHLIGWQAAISIVMYRLHPFINNPTRRSTGLLHWWKFTALMQSVKQELCWRDDAPLPRSYTSFQHQNLIAYFDSVSIKFRFPRPRWWSNCIMQ